MQFGLWTEIERLGRFSKCKCECGTVREVIRRDMVNGKSTGCGCTRKGKMRAAQKAAVTVHGMTKTPEFVTWTEMRRRCYAKHRKEYKNYGGRGIEVCPEWRDSFENFYRDMGVRPSGHTLDRRDNNGPYSKENCIWATYKQQGRNTRFNRHVEAHGRKMTIAEAAELSGISRNCALQRLAKGWSVERTFSKTADIHGDETC